MVAAIHSSTHVGRIRCASPHMVSARGVHSSTCATSPPRPPLLHGLFLSSPCFAYLNRPVISLCSGLMRTQGVPVGGNRTEESRAPRRGPPSSSMSTSRRNRRHSCVPRCYTYMVEATGRHLNTGLAHLQYRALTPTHPSKLTGLSCPVSFQ